MCSSGTIQNWVTPWIKCLTVLLITRPKFYLAKLLAILGNSKFWILHALKYVWGQRWRVGGREARGTCSKMRILSIPTSLGAGCGHPVLLHVSPSLGLPAYHLPSPCLIVQIDPSREVKFCMNFYKGLSWRTAPGWWFLWKQNAIWNAWWCEKGAKPRTPSPTYAVVANAVC